MTDESGKDTIHFKVLGGKNSARNRRWGLMVAHELKRRSPEAMSTRCVKDFIRENGTRHDDPTYYQVGWVMRMLYRQGIVWRNQHTPAPSEGVGGTITTYGWIEPNPSP
jgi:hypothetical protein